MFPVLALLLQLPAAQLPRRSVPDSGVIASGQTVTPAGVRSVFEGRVTGVRFGESSRDLWVAAAGAAYHLAWSDDRLLARVPIDGAPGVHAIAVDRVRHRALVSFVGRLPATTTVGRLPGSEPRAHAHAVAHLTAIDASARGARAAIGASSGALGEFIAGAPAVARRANASGHRVAVVPLPADDRLALLDADADTLLATIPLGVAPIAAAISDDGATAWVTNLGGEHPRPGDRAARECCDPRAEPVRVDARGLAEPGTVSRVDLVARRVAQTVAVGLHPTGIAWDERRARLYVADGNSDAITVVDTRTGTVAATARLEIFEQPGIGLTPTAVALSPDGSSLYVALGGVNAVAVYDVATGGAPRLTLRGLLPTDWYPSSLDVSADGRQLAVGALFGVGAGEGSTGGSPGKRGRFVFAERGAANVIELPPRAQLDAYTTAVARNAHLTLRHDATRVAGPRPGVAPRAVPERPGEPSLVDHVVFIVRENRTYDQVLGDLGRGDGDSTLTIFGRAVTPNAHALSERFVTLDRTFANGGNSADGHQWLTQANETEYATWPLYVGRSYPSEGVDALAYSSGGFLWEAARSRGRSVAVFGEYAPAPSDSISSVRADLLAQHREHGNDPAYFRDLLRRRYDTRSPIPSLDSVLVREYPGWTQEVPDVVKAGVILDHLREWEQAGSMPNLVMIILPSDHTVGTSPGWCTPRACVADNDLALGRIVDGFTHSSFWKSMAIFAIEDDAQNGVDHVDGHRTVALAISPFARRGLVDHTFYSQPSVLKTIELMLGLPALSLFDLTATDMRASFIGEGEAPDLTPYVAATPAQSIYETNVRVGDIRGPGAAARRGAARASARMRFDIPDAAPSEALNRILWHDARGWSAPYPRVQHALFFPMSLDVDDDDRR